MKARLLEEWKNLRRLLRNFPANGSSQSGGLEKAVIKKETAEKIIKNLEKLLKF